MDFVFTSIFHNFFSVEPFLIVLISIQELVVTAFFFQLVLKFSVVSPSIIFTDPFFFDVHAIILIFVLIVFVAKTIFGVESIFLVVVVPKLAFFIRILTVLF